MQLLPPVGWAEVARTSDVESLGIHLRSGMAGLRSEVRDEMAELRGGINAQLPRLYAANIASMLGVAGLVLAAARLS